jgi:hypothetical protein
MVATPLPVLVGLNDPQLPLSLALQLQVTPLFVGSFATVAVTDAVVPTGIEAGGGWLRVTVSCGVVIATFWETVADVSALDVAVMVTVPLAGRTVGAVYAVSTPLAVSVGLNEPQFPPVPAVQLTVQETPFGGVVLSFVTVALICTVASATIVAGGASPEVKAIVMAVEGSMVTFWLTDMLELAPEAAVIVTVPPVGMMVGAV